LPKVVCDTSSLQYLHQLELLHILPALAQEVIVPPAVMDELKTGRSLGVNLPDPSELAWISVRRPASAGALPLVTDLGPGETEVLMLALEFPEAVAVLDDALARRVAKALGLKFTGTLGLLIDAKRAKLIPAVTPYLDRLQALRFRLAQHTREAVLKLAGEEPETT
jgi:predicted nucleic acid-binding protein